MSIQRPTTNARPLSRTGRRLSASALVLGLGVLLLLGPLAPSASADTATPAPALDSTFATLLNTLRASLGLGSLTVDPQLSDVARGWSTHMATTQVMSHNPALTSQVPSWAKLGENVGTGGAVTQIFNALVASPPHMRNMSDPQFNRIGVATVTDSQGRLWTTHVFEQPKDAAAAAPAPRVAAPAPVPAPARAARPTPSPTAAAPVTAPPTTAAPVPTTVPVPTTSAPSAVAVAEVAAPTAAAEPENPPALTSAHPGSEPETRLPLLAGAALLAVLVLGGAGFLVRRRRPGDGASSRPAENLTDVLDLLQH